MKKRDFFKSSVLALGASALALSGCNKEEVAGNSDELNIVPKQTGTYEFSCPLPFNYKTIDEIAELNSTLKKSKVTSFYNNAPNWEHNNWVSIDRAKNDFIKTYDDFFKYVDYAQNKGFKFTYLMNSPKSYSQNNYKTFEKDFIHLLDLLNKHNCKDIKIGNAQTGRLINSEYPNTFNLHVSTALEYNLVSQYELLKGLVPNLTLFDITNGENQNFKLLSALRKKFPNIKLELMVNESCLKGCPMRVACISDNVGGCQELFKQYTHSNFFVRMGFIYPWNLEYYSALGINNFKYISSGKDNSRKNYNDISNLKAYLGCVENGVENISVEEFFKAIFYRFHGFADNKLDLNTKLSEIIDLFPDIRHFVKHGSECATRCGVDCNYCFDCAKKLESKLLYG